MTSVRRSLLLMGIFLVLWAGVEMIAAHILSRYSPYQVVWMRYAVHLCVVLGYWGWRTPPPWATRRLSFQLVRSLLMLGMPACWVISMQSGVRSDTLMALFWTAPVWILALSALFLRERASLRLWIAALLATAGTQLLFGPALPSSAAAIVFPLGMALTFSLYVVMTRSLRFEPIRSNLFYTAAGVFAALTPFMPFVWKTPPVSDLVVIVAIGVLGFFALLSVDRMAAAAPLSSSATFASLQPAGLLVFAYLMGETSLHARLSFGILLIVGVALYLWRQGQMLVGADVPSAAGTG